MIVNSWSVAWGDGDTDPIGWNAPTAQHTYYNGGNAYTINATASTDLENIAANPVTVAVNDVPANIVPISDQTVDPGSPHSSISTTFTDPGINETHSGTIDWGDGTPITFVTINESSGSGTISATHTYQTYGNYVATLQVTDSGGAVASQQFNVTAYVPPILAVVARSRPGCRRSIGHVYA